MQPGEGELPEQAVSASNETNNSDSENTDKGNQSMKRTQAIELPQEEIAKQKEWMAEFAALEDQTAHLLCGDIRLPDERA